MEWLGVDLEPYVVELPVLTDEMQWDSVIDKQSSFALINSDYAWSQDADKSVISGTRWQDYPVTLEDGRKMFASQVNTRQGLATFTIQNIIHKYFKNVVNYVAIPTQEAGLGDIIHGLLTSAGVPDSVIDLASLQAVKIFYNASGCLFNAYFLRKYGIKLIDALNICCRAGSLGVWCDEKIHFVLPVVSTPVQSLTDDDFLQAPQEHNIGAAQVYRHYALSYQFDAGTPATNSVALLAESPDYTDTWVESFDATANLQIYNKSTADFLGQLKVNRDNRAKSVIQGIAHAEQVYAQLGSVYRITVQGGTKEYRLISRQRRGNVKTLRFEEVL
jgi:hypothetical protein